MICILSLTAIGVASAQTVDLSYLQSLLNNLSSQVAQVSVGASRVNSVSSFVSTVPGCRGTSGFSSTTGLPCSGNSIPTTATTDRSSVATIVPVVPTPAQPPSSNGVCSGGATMPSGTLGQTIYCNGVRWVSSGNLWHNGNQVGIGTTTPSNYGRLVVDSGNNWVALSGTSLNGWGVMGISLTGQSDGQGVRGIGKTGVYGESRGDDSAGVSGVAAWTRTGKAVKATNWFPDSYGFYQDGAANGLSNKNYFESPVGIGVENPDPVLGHGLDVAGGVKIGGGFDLVGGAARLRYLSTTTATGTPNTRFFVCVDQTGYLSSSVVPCRQ